MKSISSIPRTSHKRKKLDAAELYYSPYLKDIAPLNKKTKMKVLKKMELKAQKIK